MPCTDGGPTYEQTQEPRRIAAALCALLTFFEAEGTIRQTLDKMDWDEAGVSRLWVEGWWDEHKREDTIRREQEAQERDRRIARQAALSKLSPDEREALGLRSR